MKIAVVGAGAMGSVYATLFAEAGHDVWAIDQWAEHVDAINRDGLRLTGFTGDRTVAMSAVTSVADAGQCDMYVIATKASGAGHAAEAVAPFVGTGTAVVTIQNGLGAAARITEHIAPEAIVVGVAQGFGAAMVGPGHSHQSGMKMLRLGELNGGETARLDKVAALWADAGFPVQTFADIDQLIWEKFICNVAVGGPSIVRYGLRHGGLRGCQSPRHHSFIRRPSGLCRRVRRQDARRQTVDAARPRKRETQRTRRDQRPSGRTRPQSGRANTTQRRDLQQRERNGATPMKGIVFLGDRKLELQD